MRRPNARAPACPVCPVCAATQPPAGTSPPSIGTTAQAAVEDGASSGSTVPLWWFVVAVLGAVLLPAATAVATTRRCYKNLDGADLDGAGLGVPGAAQAPPSTAQRDKAARRMELDLDDYDTATQALAEVKPTVRNKVFNFSSGTGGGGGDGAPAEPGDARHYRTQREAEDDILADSGINLEAFNPEQKSNFEIATYYDGDRGSLPSTRAREPLVSWRHARPLMSSGTLCATTIAHAHTRVAPGTPARAGAACFDCCPLPLCPPGHADGDVKKVATPTGARGEQPGLTLEIVGLGDYVTC